MARRDIAGLLTGIPSSGGSSFADVMTRSAGKMGGLMGRYGKAVFTGDSRSNEQRLADDIANIDSATPEAQKDLIGRLQASGESSVASQLSSQLKENIKEEKVDKSAEMLKNFATKTPEEKKNIINVLRSQGQIALAGQLASQMSTEVTQAQAQERLDIQRLATEQRKTELGRADLKYIRDAEDSADKAATMVPTLLNMANEYSKLKPTGGWFGTAMEAWKDFVGGQDAVSRVKTKFDQVQNSNIIASLPPGLASDKDIAMASKGFMDSTWNPDEIEQYLRGQAKLSAFLAEKNSAKAEYVSANGGDSSGFRDHWDTIINQEGYKDAIRAKHNLPAYDIPKAPVQFNEDKVPVDTPPTSGRQVNPLGRRR
jgi:hypothetical protein